MPRDPLAWQPLLRHWTRCLGAGGTALEGLGDLAAIEGLNLAKLLPGGPGWGDVQRCLRHDPEGAFRLLDYGLALRGLEALLAPERLVSADSTKAPQVSVLIPVHNQWAITLNALRSLVAMANCTRFAVIVADDAQQASTRFQQRLSKRPWGATIHRQGQFWLALGLVMRRRPARRSGRPQACHDGTCEPPRLFPPPASGRPGGLLPSIETQPDPPRPSLQFRPEFCSDSRV